MAKAFKVPKLGENVASATVSKVLVSEGDQVELEQPVVELETDKAVTEVPCDIAGTVEKVHIKEGDDVEVGQTLLTLKAHEAAGGKDEQAETTADEAPAEDETEAGDTEAVEKEEDEKPEPEARRENRPQPSDGPPAPAAPSVRRFAREIGVDIHAVQGNGPNGRISMDDVKAYARSDRQDRGKTEPSAELPDFSPWGETERKPMDKVRRLTAEAMSRAWSLAPQATQFGKADVTEVEKLRQRFKQDAEAAGGHLSLTVILVKAVAGALKAFPRFNASVDGARHEIVYKRYCHIGLAMDTERGLVVPVIRNADRKNVIELAVAMKELTDRAREGKLNADEMRGGSLTITNAGALGGDTFIPIVNWPEVAILGMARTRIEPVFQDGQFQPRTLLPLALSYDHRIIDGADGVRFMQWLVEALEDPIKMAWEG